MAAFNLAAMLAKSKEKQAQTEEATKVEEKKPAGGFAFLTKKVETPATIEKQLEQLEEISLDDIDGDDSRDDEPKQSELKDFNHPLMKDLDPIEVENFRTNMEFLYNSLEDKEIVSTAVSTVLLHLREHPEFLSILAPEHIGMMVRGLRESHGVMLASKQENRTKRASKKASSADFGDLDLGDLDV